MNLFVISQYEVSRLSNTNCVKVSSERRSSSTLYDQYFYPISTRCSSNLKPSIFMVPLVRDMFESTLGARKDPAQF